MTRDDIIKMAREAGSIDSDEVIETVFAAFAAAEREACAKVLDWNREMCQPNGTLDTVLHACAFTIRARGNT